MWRATSKIRRFLASDGGPTAAEYAVMAVFVFATLIVVITAIASIASAHFGTASSSAFS